MSLREFSFLIRIEDPAPSVDLVGDLAVAIARHVGWSPDHAAEIVAAVGRAFADPHAGGAPCDVQFRAHAGELQVSVSGERRQWRASRPLP